MNNKRDTRGRFAIIHGEGKGTKLYHIWDSMIRRCHNKNHQAYPRYGSRGIYVEDITWFDFIPFRDWALATGYESGLSIDRINNNKGYCPQNCKWITRSENSSKDKVLKPVNQLSLSGGIIATFPSIASAKKETDIGHICEVITNKYGHKTAGGYRWEYANQGT